LAIVVGIGCTRFIGITVTIVIDAIPTDLFGTGVDVSITIIAVTTDGRIAIEHQTAIDDIVTAIAISIIVSEPHAEIDDIAIIIVDVPIAIVIESVAIFISERIRRWVGIVAVIIIVGIPIGWAA
jgi:hypothetical protein